MTRGHRSDGSQPTLWAYDDEEAVQPLGRPDYAHLMAESQSLLPEVGFE
jgi:hypothetical protein